jgi:type IV pilus assembly protein PilN
MIKINLLPEEFRTGKRKLRITPRWGYTAAAVAGFFVILFALTMWQRSRLVRVEDQIRQAKIEAERQKADLELVRELTALKERVLQRMQVVEQLNQNRTRWIEILTALSKSVPGDTWLMAFKEDGGSQARIQGMSFSLRPIALFMNNLDETQWFVEPRFTYAQRIPVQDGLAYDFEIMTNLLSYEKETAAAADSAQASPGKGHGQRGKNEKG